MSNDFHELIQVLSMTLFPFKDFPGIWKTAEILITYQTCGNIIFYTTDFPTPNKQCQSTESEIITKRYHVEKMFIHKWNSSPAQNH